MKRHMTQKRASRRPGVAQRGSASLAAPAGLVPSTLPSAPPAPVRPGPAIAVATASKLLLDGITKPGAPDLRESARSSVFDCRTSTGRDQESACFDQHGFRSRHRHPRNPRFSPGAAVLSLPRFGLRIERLEPLATVPMSPSQISQGGSGSRSFERLLSTAPPQLPLPPLPK